MNKRAKTNTIRIIAGRWRGRRLPVLDHDGLRPTTDRVRETLFNWLMHDIAGSRCLDLFAGTGVLGLECLSRAAKFVEFVDVERSVVEQLRNNIVQLDAVQSTSVVQGNALDFLNCSGGLNRSAIEPFDLVFLDPPFASSLLQPCIDLLDQRGWLKPGAMVYVEQDSKLDAVLIPSHWTLHRNGTAGQSQYHLYCI